MSRPVRARSLEPAAPKRATPKAAAPKPPASKPATPTTPRVDTGKRDKSEAILDAALHIVMERGFHGATVPDIAARAGVSAGSIYTYFASKDALVNTLYRKWKNALARRVYTDFPAGSSPQVQFETMWRSMAAFALEHPDALSFLELQSHKSYLDTESRALENQLKDFAAAAFAAGQAMGVFKPIDVPLLLELLFGAFGGMLRAHLEGRLVLDERTIEASLAACWEMVAAR